MPMSFATYGHLFLLSLVNSSALSSNRLQAGGSAVDALRSIIISEQLLGTTSILLIKHTGYGMLTFENRDIYPIINRNLGQGATGELEVQSFDFLPFPDLEEAVREDVEFLRKSQLVPRTVEVSGWVYEVETGKVREVV